MRPALLAEGTPCGPAGGAPGLESHVGRARLSLPDPPRELDLALVPVCLPTWSRSLARPGDSPFPPSPRGREVDGEGGSGLQLQGSSPGQTGEAEANKLREESPLSI